MFAHLWESWVLLSLLLILVKLMRIRIRLFSAMRLRIRILIDSHLDAYLEPAFYADPDPHTWDADLQHRPSDPPRLQGNQLRAFQ
jgi:hypothetical protein